MELDEGNGCCDHITYTMLRLLLLLVLHIHCVFGNTEKVIFLAPNALQIPLEHPTLEDLQLEALSPQQLSLRTHIEAEFPKNSSKYGKESWYLLHGLNEGQRYEVRICWAATVRLLSSRWIQFLADDNSNQHPFVWKSMTFQPFSKLRI